MFCPKCGRQQYYICSNPACKACRNRVPEGELPQKQVTLLHLACPYCGFTAEFDWWEELDYMTSSPSEEGEQDV